MRTLLIAALIVFPGAGHHYGWQHGRHNPHHRVPCVVWRPGCPGDVQVPPPPFPRPTP